MTSFGKFKGCFRSVSSRAFECRVARLSATICSPSYELGAFNAPTQHVASGEIPQQMSGDSMGKILTTSFPHRNISIHSEWYCLRSSVMIQVSDFIGDPKRSSEVTIGHQRVFLITFDSEEMRPASGHILFHSYDALRHMQYDLLVSPPDLDLRSNFDLELTRSPSRCFDASWREKRDGTKMKSVS